MKWFSLFLLFLSLLGCKLLPQYKKDQPGNTAIPNDYTVSGITLSDNQIVQPVRCVDSLITVKVLAIGETQWRTCNPYEARISTIGAGGGGVFFGRKSSATFDTNGNLLYLILYDVPVAPKGSQYEVHSIKIY